MKHLPFALAAAVVVVLLAAPLLAFPTLAFCFRSQQPTTKLFLGNAKGGYSTMPPLSISTPSPRGSIFKVLKRDVYPTVDLPLHDNNYTSIDHYFMGMALQQAQRAWDKDEVPIGAIIVREFNDDDVETSVDNEMVQEPSQTKRTFQVIAKAHNRVETNVDASAHAELMALRRGAKNLQNWRFPPNSRLYTTLEPCPMCLASIQAFRIDNIVYGAPDNRLGAIKTHMDLMSVAKHPYHEVKSVTGGVREEECGDIMVRFFRERRRKKKEKEVKDIGGGGRELLKLPLKNGVKDTERKLLRLRFLRFMRVLLRRE